MTDLVMKIILCSLIFILSFYLVVESQIIHKVSFTFNFDITEENMTVKASRKNNADENITDLFVLFFSSIKNFMNEVSIPKA